MEEKKPIISKKTKILILVILGVFLAIAIPVGNGIAEQKHNEELYKANQERVKNQPVYVEAKIVDSVIYDRGSSYWSDSDKLILFRVQIYNPWVDTYSFGSLVNVTALQDGVKLDQTYGEFGERNCQYNQSTKEVVGDGTAEIWCAFELDYDDMPVTVRVYDYYNETNVLEEIFKIK